MSEFNAVILAAGKGTRMNSEKPKVLHEICGEPMICHVLRAVYALNPQKIVLVLAPGMEPVAKVADGVCRVEIVIQGEQKGTAHAVNCAMEILKNSNEPVLIAYGDTPLVTSQTLQALVERVNEKNVVALLAFELKNPKGYGRVMVNDEGEVEKIVEEKDANDIEKKTTLCNSGMMAVSGKYLWQLLAQVTPKNAQSEFYLTDIVKLAKENGQKIALVKGNEVESIGVNSRIEQAKAEAEMQFRLRNQAMENGVTLIAPETIFLNADTKFGCDVVVHPHVVFGKKVVVGNNVEIRSFSHIEGAEIGAGAIIGPFARLRPGTSLAENVHVGNFVEIKNSKFAKGAKANHLSYIGDADVGAAANIGAGTITCNYDGVNKHKTTIGAGAFIGSNASLVAPVSVGDGAIIGAGSVITIDVPADALALTRSEQKTKPESAKKFRGKK